MTESCFGDIYNLATGEIISRHTELDITPYIRVW